MPKYISKNGKFQLKKAYIFGKINIISPHTEILFLLFYFLTVPLFVKTNTNIDNKGNIV